MTKEERIWYAVYTKPRWEKKVYQLLTDKSITAYCPLNKVSKRWSDRTKIVMEPLFKSYVFTFLTKDEMVKVRMTQGVLNFVYWLGKPAVIKEKEITLIKKFLDEYENVQVEPISLSPNQRVRIKKGIFMEKEGEVLKILNNRVVIAIESLGYQLIAQVNKTNVETIKDRNYKML
ncbi:MAG TPA: UpxY family transcription antiterminator [Chitinophagaceae bacterium]|nr:UpxY family transcription antiterminator [Chitinophagaceae bacterium]